MNIKAADLSARMIGSRIRVNLKRQSSKKNAETFETTIEGKLGSFDIDEYDHDIKIIIQISSTQWLRNISLMYSDEVEIL